MKERFIALYSRLNIKSGAGQTFCELHDMYHESHRFYHNWKHIECCLKELDSARPLCDNPDLVELAIWFHDAVFDTRAKDNEEKSAYLAFESCIAAGLSGQSSEIVKDLVLSTKHDQSPADMDAKVLTDCDLSILGKTGETYSEFETSIRKEYSWVPEERFLRERAAVLKLFLEREQVFSTVFFREKYEKIARNNLMKSIQNLISDQNEER